MSCSVAVSNSPVFRPPSSSSRFSNNMDTLSLTLSHFKSPKSPTSPPSPSSSTTPRQVRLHKSPSALRSLHSSSTSTSTSALGSSQVVSKRKRPAMLDIPALVVDFGCDASLADEGTLVEEVEMERVGYGYSVYCKRGRRESMEDRFSATVALHGDPKQALFGIFDGHGGSKAAQFSAENLHKNILKEIARADERGIENAVRCGYLNTDSQFLKEDLRGGSCCLTALIMKGSLVVSNAGDCRAVISTNGIAEPLTSDHRPSSIDERDRVESNGGYVDMIHGAWRIQGSLAVSRGIGDRNLKKWVIAEPETKIIALKPEDELLILASDGLWDKVSNQEAVNIARSLCLGTADSEPLLACKKLVDLAASRSSTDDISVMIIQLRDFV